MDGKYNYLKGIRTAIEERLGRSLSENEFQRLLRHGEGRFWELNWQSNGIRLYDLPTSLPKTGMLVS